MQRTQANGRLSGIAASHSGRSELSSMKSTQANGQLSSIAASPSGYSELSSIAVDQPAYQLTGNQQPAAVSSQIE